MILKETTRKRISILLPTLSLLFFVLFLLFLLLRLFLKGVNTLPLIISYLTFLLLALSISIVSIILTRNISRNLSILSLVLTTFTLLTYLPYPLSIFYFANGIVPNNYDSEQYMSVTDFLNQQEFSSCWIKTKENENSTEKVFDSQGSLYTLLYDLGGEKTEKNKTISEEENYLLYHIPYEDSASCQIYESGYVKIEFIGDLFGPRNTYFCQVDSTKAQAAIDLATNIVHTYLETK